MARDIVSKAGEEKILDIEYLFWYNNKISNRKGVDSP